MPNKSVKASVNPTWVQAADPSLITRPFVGASWLDTSAGPYLLKTWDGSTWVVNDSLYFVNPKGYAGYVLGGGGHGASYYSTVVRLVFETEVTALLASTLAGIAANVEGATTQVAGYMKRWTPVDALDKLHFGTEVTSVVTGAPLSINRGSLAVSQNYYSKAYWSGGYNASVSTYTRIDGFLLSTETMSPITSTLTAGRYNVAACASFVNMYVGPGNTNPSLNGYEAPIARVDRLIFSSETTSMHSQGQITAQIGATAFSVVSKGRGYWAGFRNSGGGYSALIQRLEFSTETIAASTSNLTVARYGGTPIPSMLDGFVAGGTVANYVRTAVIDKIRFEDETVAAVTSALPAANASGAGVSDYGGVV